MGLEAIVQKGDSTSRPYFAQEKASEPFTTLFFSFFFVIKKTQQLLHSTSQLQCTLQSVASAVVIRGSIHQTYPLALWKSC
jgi:hypothetical protein